MKKKLLLWIIAAATAAAAFTPAACAFGQARNLRMSYLDSGLERRITGAVSNRDALLCDCDLNDLTHPDGIYRLDGYRYENTPAGMKNGWLLVQTGGPCTFQTFYSSDDHSIWTRVSKLVWADGTFVSIWPDPWQQIENEALRHRQRTQQGKYVAFGASVCWGSVWSPTAGTPLHRVREDWQIPTRTAIAIGKGDNFENQGVGGIGYFTRKNGRNIVEMIQAYDFTDVSLVTIMAGANDHFSVDLGTHTDSESAWTMCGAIRKCIHLVKASNPDTQIVIIQLTPAGVDGNKQDIWSTVSSGSRWSLNQFDEQVSQLCADEGVGYVNWYGCEVCENWKYVGYSGTTGPNYTHPTDDAAYLALGDFIGARIAEVLRLRGWR